MDKFLIRGGVPLKGEIATGGAKNSALPALAACLLTDEPVVLQRIPQVRDIRTMEKLLRSIGAGVEQRGGTLQVETRFHPLARGPLRAGENDARFQSGAGSLAGAGPPRARLPAWRLRHRSASH